MSELGELYREMILDHYRRPRNTGRLADPTHEAEGANPLCGDELTLQLRVVDDVIEDVAFEGSGCAISTASASVMTETLKGKPVADARRLFAEMMDMLTGDPTEEALPGPELGKLVVFAGVRAFPGRVKCATMAWHTLRAALEGGGRVSTE